MGINNENKQIDKIDRITICIYVVINALILYILYEFPSWFFIDAPFFLTHFNGSEFLELYFSITDRFFPLPVSFYSIIASFFEASPNIEMFFQYLLWLFGAFALFCILSKLKIEVKYRIAVLLLLQFLTTFAENMFTVGKQEPFLVTSFAWALLAFLEYLNGKRGYIFVYLIAIFFASLSKETFFIIIVPVILVLLYSIVFNKNIIKRALTILAVTIGYLVLYLIYRHIYVLGGNYTTYSVSLYQIVSNLYSYAKIHFDILTIGIVGGVCSMRVFLRKKTVEHAMIMICNLVGWCYLLGISLWRWAQPYYLLPVLAFFVISMGAFFVDDIHRVTRNLITVLLVFISIYAIDYNYKVASSHIDLGQAYTDATFSIIKNTTSDDKILIENWLFYEEQIRETEELLKYYGEEREIYGIKQELDGEILDEENVRLFGYTMDQYQQMKEKMIPEVGDYVLVNYNKRNFRGTIRAVNPVSLYADGSSFLFKNGYEMELVDKGTIKRNWINLFNKSLREENVAGFALYKVTGKGIITSGIYNDGWTSQEFCIYGLNSYLGKVELLVNDFAASWHGNEGVDIDVIVDGKVIDTIYVEQNDKISISQYGQYINDALEPLKFVVKETDSPNNYGSNDIRELGIKLELEYFN